MIDRTVTEEVLERLQPTQTDSRSTNSVAAIGWPLLPEATLCPRSPSSPSDRKTDASTSLLHQHKKPLIRSSSLNRLRQFPSYLCSQSSSAIPTALKFLQTTLRFLAVLVRSSLLHVQTFYQVWCVYLGLSLILFEVSACSIAVSVGDKPFGLGFMLCSAAALALIAIKVMISEPARLSRTKSKDH